ncbi:MAG: PQQ-binding-like beta-propeller repeat protein [Verrucomicrobiae bacterium]|nr:PQQ-binding-like beta-propeller repeat protein [Verrucomicrobiae bacterium]
MRWTMCGLAGSVFLVSLAAGLPGRLGAEAFVFDGKPLEHWVGEAKSPARKEDVGKVVRALTAALSDPVAEARVAAGDALGALGKAAKPAAAALVAQMDHESPWVRTAASETLAVLGAEALPELVEGFKKMPVSGKVRIGLIFEAIGAGAKPVVPFLREQAKGDAAAMADRIEAIIAMIEGADAAQGKRGGGGSGDGVLERRPPREADTDWPGFRGPRRDGVCAETGLLKEWPGGGPPLAWKAEGLGRGYSSVSIVGERLFTMGDRAEGGGEAQFLLCLDLTSKRQLWAARVGGPNSDGGPRCTPTVDGDRVYALGTDGDLVCASTADGSVRWQRNLAKDFGGKMMSVWKFSESPLVDGDRVVCTPGGPDAAVVALDKLKGETLWKCAIPDLGPKGKDGAGYSSIAVAEIHGVRQYVQLMGRGAVGIAAEDGRFLWGYNPIANGVANIPIPVVCGSHVIVSTAYNTGCALLHIVREGGAWRADEAYFLPGRVLQNHHGGMVMVGRYLYAGDGPNKGDPTCLEVATGEIMWKEKAAGRGSAAVLYADGHVIFRYDRGPVHLVEATPEAYRVKGEFTPLQGKGPAWSYPVIHRGMLYLRHDDLLAVYDVRAKR